MTPTSLAPSLPLDRLALRCLAGDQKAWHQFHCDLGPRLTAAVCRQLGRYPRHDRRLVEAEDVLQELWLRLYDAPGRGAGALRRLLAAGKPLRPALEDFARALADNAVRSARSRRRREAAVGRPPQSADLGGWLALATTELSARLSARDRALLLAELGQGSVCHGSPAAARQRSRRLRRRVERLLAGP